MAVTNLLLINLLCVMLLHDVSALAVFVDVASDFFFLVAFFLLYYRHLMLASTSVWRKYFSILLHTAQLYDTILFTMRNVIIYYTLACQVITGF